MIVIDTSAVIQLLAPQVPDPSLKERVSGEEDFYAPHLIDIEVLHALAGLVRGRKLSEDRAADARVDYMDLRIVRYPHLPLWDRIWELRHKLTAYDAAFVALSEILAAPLITCDGRLSRSGHSALVEVF